MFLVIFSILVFWTPLSTVVRYSLTGGHQYDKYSHILLIPFITLALVYFETGRIFKSVQYDHRIGVVLLLLSLILDGWAGVAANQLGPENALSAKILALILFWNAGFILCYGMRAFRAAAFPLLLLLLAVPIPDLLLDVPISFVRHESADVCSLIFNLAGVPYLRDGYLFALPTISIEVAKECSGIHSTIALVIVGLVAAHLFLPSLWKKILLVLLALPIVCFTNGLRIAGLTLLSVYVDPRFMHSGLHRDGGVAFFTLGLVLMYAILRLLQRGQRVKRANA